MVKGARISIVEFVEALSGVHVAGETNTSGCVRTAVNGLCGDFMKKSGFTEGRKIFRYWRWRGFSFKSDLIAHDYMRRWVLQTPWFMLRLHHILRSDVRDYFHDHSMDFVSLVLRGGYVEYMPDGSRVCKPGSIVRRRAEDLHYLELLKDSAWTLLVTGQYRRDWGFQTEDGWIAAGKYDAWKRSKKNGEARA
jgi:hypothetical protein